MEDYAPIVHSCIRAGFIIRFETNEHHRIMHAQPTRPEDWGFNAAALQTTKRAIELIDRKLLNFLTYGGYNYSANTPLVSWFAPHSVSVYRHWGAFADSACRRSA